MKHNCEGYPPQGKEVRWTTLGGLLPGHWSINTAKSTALTVSYCPYCGEKLPGEKPKLCNGICIAGHEMCHEFGSMIFVAESEMDQELGIYVKKMICRLHNLTVNHCIHGTPIEDPQPKKDPKP